MKAQELRIGNYVLFANDGTIFTVNTIEGYGMILLNKDEDTWIEYDQIEPIPLTEELLLKFGNAEKDSRFSNEITIYDRFQFIWKENYKYWYVITRDSKEYLTKIEFVHEYQNFIFALTGNELELK
jgi:hypothetical protein